MVDKWVANVLSYMRNNKSGSLRLRDCFSRSEMNSGFHLYVDGNLIVVPVRFPADSRPVYLRLQLESRYLHLQVVDSHHCVAVWDSALGRGSRVCCHRDQLGELSGLRWFEVWLGEANEESSVIVTRYVSSDAR